MGIYLESATSEALLVFVGLLTAIYYFFTNTRNYWKNRGVPFVPPTPFFGNLASLLTAKKSAGEAFMDLYNAKELEGQPFAGAWMSRNPILLAHGPEFIKDILIKDFQYFSSRGMTTNEKEPLSTHLFNLGGWRWRVLRTRLTPTFTSGKMKLMYGTMAECAEGLEKLLNKEVQNGGIAEIKEPLAKFTTDIIGTCAFGLSFNSMTGEDSEFRRMGRSIFDPSFKFTIFRAIALTVPPLAKFLNLSFIDSKVSKFFLNAVDETVKYREDNKIIRNDMMQLLLDVKKQGPIVDEESKYETTSSNVPKDEQGRQILELDNNLLAAQAFIFFLAGFETSSTTMSFALYELARNSEIQEKLAEEIQKAFSNNGGEMTYDVIQDMKYLDMVISETLRRFPPVMNLFRQVTKPYKLPGTDVVLSKGLRVFIPVYAIHNDPKYYPNPSKFDPERFSYENKKDRHPMVYLPFGEGPRNCIGARFGLLQTKIGLTTVLRKFRVEVCDKTQIPPVLDPRAFVATIQNGVYLKIVPRTYNNTLTS